MLKRTLTLVACAAALVAVLSSDARACSCDDPGPPCQAFWDAGAVFVGTALGSARIAVESDGEKEERRLFRFRVEEALRGVEGREVEVLTGLWGGDCGYDFETGTKYVIYGYKAPGEAWIITGTCTRTRPLAEADEDLAFARGLSNLPAGGEIFGSARRYLLNLETSSRDEAGAVAGARVTAESGGRRLAETTGPDGAYRFRGLAPGRYTVRVELPPKLSPQEEKTVEVHDRGCAQIDYAAVLDGRLVGRVLDARGRSPGIVTLDLLPLAAGKELRALWAVTEPDGSFVFKELPPGRYVLGVNVGDAPDKDLPYRTTFYPAAREPGAARVFELGEGEHVAGVVFRLPPPLARAAIKGVVVWPDGRPAAGGSVSLEEVASGRPVGMDVKADGRGRFLVPAFAGVRYKVRASIPADPNWNPNSGVGVALLVSPEVEVTPSARARPLRLVIDARGGGVRRTTNVVGPGRTPRPGAGRRTRP